MQSCSEKELEEIQNVEPCIIVVNVFVAPSTTSLGFLFPADCCIISSLEGGEGIIRVLFTSENAISVASIYQKELEPPYKLDFQPLLHKIGYKEVLKYLRF